MRLLIDECVDERLRLLFHGHECQTARFAKLAGVDHRAAPTCALNTESMISCRPTAIFEAIRACSSSNSAEGVPPAPNALPALKF